MLLRGEEGGLQQAGGLVEVPFAGEGGEEFPRLADGGGQGVALGGLEGGAGQLLRLLGAVGAGGVEGQVGGGDVDEGARPLVGATPQQGAGVGDGAVAVLPAACGVGDLGEAGVEDGEPGDRQVGAGQGVPSASARLAISSISCFSAAGEKRIVAPLSTSP
ncbi:hypothetical protein AB0R11_18130, partial [Streptomyces fradiae]